MFYFFQMNLKKIYSKIHLKKIYSKIYGLFHVMTDNFIVGDTFILRDVFDRMRCRHPRGRYRFPRRNPIGPLHSHRNFPRPIGTLPLFHNTPHFLWFWYSMDSRSLADIVKSLNYLSPRPWHTSLRSMHTHGYERTPASPCYYFWRLGCTWQRPTDILVRGHTGACPRNGRPPRPTCAYPTDIHGCAQTQEWRSVHFLPLHRT